MNIQHYLKYKTRYEVLLWTLFIVWQMTANIYVAVIDTESANVHVWEPVLWESSSTLMFAVLVPLLLWFDDRVPLSIAALKRGLPLHLLFTLPFAALHVLGMVAIREVGYWWMGGDYSFGNWGSEFLYEYTKDFRTYFYLLGILYLYRLILFRIQGEASVPATSEDEVPDSNPVAGKQHLLVKKLGKEFLVKIQDIEWLEACGNYVNLHVAGRTYPYRGTMKSLQSQLDEQQFLRVHRSFMVNYNQIQSIQPLESGDASLQLLSGQELPFSRRYRADFKQVG